MQYGIQARIKGWTRENKYPRNTPMNTWKIELQNR